MDWKKGGVLRSSQSQQRKRSPTSCPKPRVRVDLSKYELTCGQWARLLQRPPLEPAEQTALIPVVNISMYDCESLFEKLNSWICLPTEAQWEYACRAGSRFRWSTGQDAQTALTVANTVEHARAEGPVAIGLLASNAFGLHDMHGNVAEWCADEWQVGQWAALRPGDGRSEKANRAANVVYRGGSYLRNIVEAGSSFRYGYGASYWDKGIGVRPVRSVTP